MPENPSWLPQKALDRMQMDLIVNADLTRAQLSEKIIEDAAPIASYTVVDMAANAEDERVRLRAAEYILDRTNGKPRTTSTLNITPTNPVLEFMQGVVVERPAARNVHPLASEDERYQSPYPPQSPKVIDQEPNSATGPTGPAFDQGPFAPPIPEDDE